MWHGSLKIQNLGCIAILSFLLRFGDSTHELHFLFARESLTNNIKSDYKSVRRILVRGSMPPCRLRRRRGWANPFAPMCGRPWVTMQRHSYRPTMPQSEDIFHRVKSINLSAVRLYIYYWLFGIWPTVTNSYVPTGSTEFRWRHAIADVTMCHWSIYLLDVAAVVCGVSDVGSDSFPVPARLSRWMIGSYESDIVRSPSRLWQTIQPDRENDNYKQHLPIDESRVHRISNRSSIHKVTVTQFCSISMSVDFCRHLVGKTLRNVCHRDSA